MVKDVNGSIEYKGNRIITLVVNVHISYVEFVSTCKFDPSILVLLHNDNKMMKMFRFNDMYYRVYMSTNTDIVVSVIPPSRYIKLHS